MRDPEISNSRQLLLLLGLGGQMDVIQFSEPGESCSHGRITVQQMCDHKEMH